MPKFFETSHGLRVKLRNPPAVIRFIKRFDSADGIPELVASPFAELSAR
ncbi:hypothetical protein HJC99_04890 [Candidatus Saccharibacteria bacterium]|nr:hypothetical protein [Candidatus Saccharibacteria bacterium]